MVKLQTRTLISSLIALLGLWLILRQVPNLASSIFIMLSGQEEVPTSILQVYAIHFCSNSVMGISLILLRDKLSSWLVPQETPVQVFFRVFIAVGTALIGVYFTGLGVISLGESLGNQDPNFGTNPYLYWHGVFSVGIGVILFMGSVGIGKLWALFIRVRHAGV